MLGISKKDLQVGDILIFPAPESSWLSQAIALLTDSKVSHAALLYKNSPQYVIAESTLGGARFVELPDEMPFVRRYGLDSEKTKKLVSRIERYIQDGTDYGYADMALLAILLIYKKMSPQKLRNRIYMKFLQMIASELDGIVDKILSKGGNMPMVCSQFAAQCYTDIHCDLTFSKFVVDINPPTADAIEGVSSSSISLFNLFHEKQQNGIMTPSQVFATPAITDDSIKENIAKDFCKLITMPDNELSCGNVDALHSSKEVCCNEKMVATVSSVMSLLEKIIGKPNFLVTPADLLWNCTNAELIGQIKD